MSSSKVDEKSSANESSGKLKGSLTKRKSRKFIDKKKSVSFHVVQRSQWDPLTADPNSSGYVLQPNQSYEDNAHTLSTTQAALIQELPSDLLQVTDVQGDGMSSRAQDFSGDEEDDVFLDEMLGGGGAGGGGLRMKDLVELDRQSSGGAGGSVRGGSVRSASNRGGSTRNAGSSTKGKPTRGAKSMYGGHAPPSVKGARSQRYAMSAMGGSQWDRFAGVPFWEEDESVIPDHLKVEDYDRNPYLKPMAGSGVFMAPGRTIKGRFEAPPPELLASLAARARSTETRSEASVFAELGIALDDVEKRVLAVKAENPNAIESAFVSAVPGHMEREFFGDSDEENDNFEEYTADSLKEHLDRKTEEHDIEDDLNMILKGGLEPDNLPVAPFNHEDMPELLDGDDQEDDEEDADYDDFPEDNGADRREAEDEVGDLDDAFDELGLDVPHGYGDEDDRATSATQDERARRELDERFDRVLDEYGDEQIGDLDPEDPELDGVVDVEEHESDLQEFMNQRETQGFRQNTHTITNTAEEEKLAHELSLKQLERLKNQPLQPEEVDAGKVIDDIFKPKPKSQWDVQSVVSTYTDTENHPVVIGVPRMPRKDQPQIKLSKLGIPVGVLGPQARRSAYDESLEETAVHEPRDNLGKARSKAETPAEKKARKQAMKEQRRQGRERKKALKTLYKNTERTVSETVGKQEASNPPLHRL